MPQFHSGRILGVSGVFCFLLVAGWLGAPSWVSAQAVIQDSVATGAFADTSRSGVQDPVRGAFGDTSWVAPDPPPPTPPVPGPRVAPPDDQDEPGWETALRTPFRIVFFPFRLLARGMEAGFRQVGGGLVSPTPPSPGVKVGIGLYAGSTNDVALGPTISTRDVLIPDSKMSLFAGWSITDHRRLRFRGTVADRQPIGFGLRALYDLKPNRRFYGIGNNTTEGSVSYHRLEDINAEAGLLFGSSPIRQIRLVGGYSAMTSKRGWNGDPLLGDVFAPEEAPGYETSTREFLYGVTGDLGLLNHDAAPSLGVHAKAEFRRAMGLRAVDPDYDQWHLEARGYLPVFSNRRVIAVRALWAGVRPEEDSSEMPFYRLAHNEGLLKFAGYPGFRFHDRQLALARAEYRWELASRRNWALSALAFHEIGEVAPSSSAFTWDRRHKAYGGGFRLGLGDASNARLELAKADEGLHITLHIGNTF